MKRSIPKRLLLSGLLAAGAAGMATQAQAAHPDTISPYITLKDVSGNAVTNGVPYSPKTTCGTTGCHTAIEDRHGLTGNLYESDWERASKSQRNRDGVEVTYDVPYPQHGVSAGSHFQQGRNISWDANKRKFYGVPEFTSSAGMYGKY